MKLGWRNPRRGNADAALHDLQRFMVWPHFVATIDAGQAVTSTYGPKTITATDDPYSMVLASDVIRVPKDFDTWLFVGYAAALIGNAGTGRYLLGWYRNGVALNNDIGEVHSATGLSVRVLAPIQLVVTQGQTLGIGASAPGATTVASGRLSGYFLPLT